MSVNIGMTKVWNLISIFPHCPAQPVLLSFRELYSSTNIKTSHDLTSFWENANVLTPT